VLAEDLAHFHHAHALQGSYRVGGG
jgi:hypothetical protein